jgi:heptosyltransferase III
MNKRINQHGARSVATVLIFRIGSLGDTIVALPCFHQVARSFPNSRRIVITVDPALQNAAAVESVLGNSGLIHGAIYFPPPPRTLRDLWALGRYIRQSGATTLVYVADRDFVRTIRDVLFFRACGIRHIIGAPLTRDLRYPQIDPRTGDTEREAERLARCLSPLGEIDVNDPAMWELHLQPDDLRVADATLAALQGHDFVAIGLGGKDSTKDWGDENWSALFKMMAARQFVINLVFFGSDNEFNRANTMATHWPQPALNLCGRLSPRESAAVMRQALFYLGHDTGPMHLAAAVGVPCVGIFGRANVPKSWHPIGAKHRLIHNMHGIREITPRAVLAAVDTLMSEKTSNLPTPHLGHPCRSTA